jgi:hypothetical protein
MANLSNYTENLIATWLAGGAAPAVLTTVYLDVYSTLPAEDGTGGTSVYQTLTGSAGRKSLTTATSFTATADQVKNNLIELTTNAGACTIVGFAIWTANTSGSMIYYGSITGQPITIGAGDTVRFDANAITLTVA